MRSPTASRRPMTARRAAMRGQRGFTLVELVYATGYFMLGMTGIMMFQVAAANGSAQAGDLMLATTLTANALETARNTPATTLTATPSSVAYFDRTGKATTGSGFFTVTTTVVPPTSTLLYFDATAATRWKSSPINPFVHGVTMQTRLGTF
jgi:Tfp pilus assembly protein PilV